MDNAFDAEAALAELRQQSRITRRQRQSRLTRYASQLLALRAAGASVADCQRWLKSQRLSVAHSTVARWFEKNG